ncbi:MAG: hypothetical protein B6U97_01105 [Candidatus Altiarchaeales archaeon ex4484_96]|nr:MAG: hypothetical protein B6U97_01105 [Candidatus Altiarchaeales archaeon ex4484_96]
MNAFFFILFILFFIEPVSALSGESQSLDMGSVTLIITLFIALIIAVVYRREVRAKDIKISNAQKKLSIGIIVISVLLVITIVVTEFQYQKGLDALIIHQFNKQQLNLAINIASGIEDLIMHQKSNMEAISRHPVGGITDVEYLARIFHEQHSNDIQHIFLLNETGHLVYLHPDNMPGIYGKDFSFREYYTKCMQTGEAYVSKTLMVGGETYEDVGGRYNSIIIAAPVYNQSNDFKGVVGVTLSISEIKKKYIYSVVSADTGFAWLIDDKGDIVAHKNREFEGINALAYFRAYAGVGSMEKIREIIVDNMLLGNKGTGCYLLRRYLNDTKESEKIIAYAPVDMTTSIWSIAVEAPTEEVIGLVKDFYTRQQQLTLAIMLVIFIATIGMAVMTLKYNELLEEDVEKRTVELEMVNENLKIKSLSLEETTNDLKDKLMELERFNKTMIDRELKMMELKKKIMMLEKKLTE